MYQLLIDDEARKALKRLPGHLRQRVARAIEALRHDSEPVEAKQLEDELHGDWRLRIDNSQVIYLIDDEIIVVEVVRRDKRDPNTYIGLR
ncbi:MAG TPA: type II toxin-antitoxin system RelE/ParE family toxin [Caldilineaceae bacterium]|nr:type II toxin-antitoxin system RelE/ParE family toxin [Caldilineaceae bacterium]